MSAVTSNPTEPRFTRSQATLYFIYFLYFLAGVTALSYEVLWARMLSLIFGVSVFGIAITVAAFLGGLGVGSFFGSRFSNRITRPILVVAVIEGVVALFSFLLPNFLNTFTFESGGHTSLNAWYWFHGVASFVILFLPAFLLGFAFATIVRALAIRDSSLGILYGANTLGGVVGALLPVLLLPAFGWTVSLRLIAILGFIICASFFFAHKIINARIVTTPKAATNPATISSRVYVAYGVIGFSALVLQIAWTRLYGMLFLRTEYVLAIILAVFLVGIGIGSFGARFLKSKNWLFVLPIIAIVFGIIELVSLGWLGSLAEDAKYNSLFDAMLTAAILIGLVTLPVTAAFGAWFPYLANHLRTSPEQSAKLYAVNSIGAATGSLVAAFVMIPTLGSTGSIIFALALLLVASLIWVQKKLLVISAVIVLPFFAILFQMPSLATLQPKFFENAIDLFSREDTIDVTHVVEKQNGERLLLADMQRMDASNEPTAVATQKNQARLPLLLQPEAKSVLFLGLGTGITAAGSLPFPLERRVAVEISNGAVEAARDWFHNENKNVLDKTEIIRDDVRRYLQYTTEKFDVVVGDLFHPDLAGRSSLLSLQQFQRVAKVLSPSGIYVQWVAINQFDAESLSIILRSFAKEFRNSIMFLDGFRLALVALPDDRLISTDALFANLGRLSTHDQLEATGAEGIWTWLGRYAGTITPSDGPTQDEWQPYIEFSIPKARYSGGADLPLMLERIIANRGDIESAARMFNVPPSDRDRFERAFFATELWASGMGALLRSNISGAQRLFRLAYDANPRDRWVVTSLADQMYRSIQSLDVSQKEKVEYLEKVLAINPDHIDAIIQLRQQKLSIGDAREADLLREKILSIFPSLRI